MFLGNGQRTSSESNFGVVQVEIRVVDVQLVCHSLKSLGGRMRRQPKKMKQRNMARKVGKLNVE